MQKKTFLFYLAVFLLAIFFDQTTKLLSAKGLLPSFYGFFTKPICNPFIAWGIPISGIIFWLFWLIALFFLLKLFLENKNFFLVLVLAGAIGNLIDRIRFGCVIDFINIKIFNFPLFNLADSLITVGIFLFILKEVSLSNLFHENQKSPQCRKVD